MNTIPKKIHLKKFEKNEITARYRKLTQVENGARVLVQEKEDESMRRD